MLVDPADRRLDVIRSRWGTHADGMPVRSAVAVRTALTKKDASDRAAGKDANRPDRLATGRIILHGTATSGLPMCGRCGTRISMRWPAYN